MKRTTDWQWAHLGCAYWVPEVFFIDGEGVEPIDYFRIPADRFEKRCMICKSIDGATVLCSESGCRNRFHVMCGMLATPRVLLEYKASKSGRDDIVLSFCGKHADAARKKLGSKMKYFKR